MSGFITIGAIADRIAVLNVACTRCDRAGRYDTAGLVKRLGRDKPGPEWLRDISADCPKRRAGNPSIYDLCGIHCPGLAQVFDT